MRLKVRKREMGQILSLALPVAAENILQTLLGTADTYFAGQIHDNAIAAIGVTNLVINIFIALLTAVSVGTTAIVARNIGKKDIRRAGLAIKQSILLGFGLGIAVGLFSALLCRPILQISGAQDEILTYAVPYYLIVAGPSVFLCLSMILSSCLRAAKDAKSPMIATGLANLLNLGLDFMFIKMGLGIVGLGLATTISRGVTVVILLLRLRKNRNFATLKLREWQPDFEMLRAISRIGIPAGIEKLVMRFGQLVYNGMILSLGASAYVAHSVAGTIESYSYIPAMGFGVAAATFVGISLGEGNAENARHLTFLCNRAATACMVLIGAVFYFFAPQLAALFTQTEQVLEMVVRVLRLIAFFQPVSALTQVLTSALQGAGDTRFPMIATLFGIWGVRVIGGYLLAVCLGWGLFGVWCGYALDLTLRAAILLVRFERGKWRQIQFA